MPAGACLIPVPAGACWKMILCSSGPSACYILVPCSSGFSPFWSMFHMFTYFTCHIRFYLFHMCFICFHVLHVWCLQYILNFLQRVFWGKAFSCAWSLVLGVWEIQVVRSGSENPGGESSGEFWCPGLIQCMVLVSTYSGIRCSVTRSYPSFPWFPLCVCF